MSNLCVITARGGSKRIPLKNIKEFCGKPILAYSIEAAFSSGIFDEIMVSTDDPHIAEIAQSFGAKVPFLRSEKTANDFATTRDVLEEVVQRYQDAGREFDYMCCIYPTAPFVTGSKLRCGLDKLISSGADWLMPMVQFSFPPQRGFIVANGVLTPREPDKMPCRSQDLEPIYHDVGQFYFYNMATFWDTQKTKITEMIEVSDAEAQDIDTMDDWKIAEMKYRIMAQE